LVPRDVPIPLRMPRELPPDVLGPTAGGGGTTWAASVGPALLFTPLEWISGGGGTTSLGPKILPIRLLMKDPLPDCDGGGGTTAFEGSGRLLLARRCGSCETSAEGGGAMTAGAGMFSRELRAEACSGAETGGAMTCALVI
jgi:hypothetical protein